MVIIGGDTECCEECFAVDFGCCVSQQLGIYGTFVLRQYAGPLLIAMSFYAPFQAFTKTGRIYRELASMMSVGTRKQRDLFKERLDEIRPLER